MGLFFLISLSDSLLWVCKNVTDLWMLILYPVTKILLIFATLLNLFIYKFQ